jgi:hypothetical protein
MEMRIRTILRGVKCVNRRVSHGGHGGHGGEDDVLRALYRRKHRLRSGQHTITVTVPGRPARAGIDQYHKLITRHKEEMGAQVQDVAIGG